MTESEKINSLTEKEFYILKEFVKACDKIIQLDGNCGEMRCSVCPLYYGFGYFSNCTLYRDVNLLLAKSTKKDLERFISLRK